MKSSRAVASLPRKLICLRLTESTNGLKIKPAERCSSERLPGSALCAHHLAQAAEEYRKLTGDE
jgi:hypothetical protein